MLRGEMRMKLQGMQIRWPMLLIVAVLATAMFFVVRDSNRRNMERAGQALIISERELSEIRMTLADKQERVSSVGKPQTTVGKAREDGMITETELCFEVTNPDRLDAYTEAEYRRLMEQMELDWDQ